MSELKGRNQAVHLQRVRQERVCVFYQWPRSQVRSLRTTRFQEKRWSPAGHAQVAAVVKTVLDPMLVGLGCSLGVWAFEPWPVGHPPVSCCRAPVVWCSLGRPSTAKVSPRARGGSEAAAGAGARRRHGPGPGPAPAGMGGATRITRAGGFAGPSAQQRVEFREI